MATEKKPFNFEEVLLSIQKDVDRIDLHTSSTESNVSSVEDEVKRLNEKTDKMIDILTDIKDLLRDIYNKD